VEIGAVRHHGDDRGHPLLSAPRSAHSVATVLGIRLVGRRFVDLMLVHAAQCPG